MWRRMGTIWVLILLFLSLFYVIDISFDMVVERASGTTLYVNTTGSGGAYTSIQDAINAANPGDTVFVYNGTYMEDININRTINLTGENRDSTIIDGDWGPENGTILISSDWVNITKFTIIQGLSGICLTSSNNSIISNNITLCKDGIWSTESSYNNIKNNYISNWDIGIYLGSLGDGGFGNKITDNIIINNSLIGIKLSCSNNTYINNNTLINNQYLEIRHKRTKVHPWFSTTRRMHNVQGWDGSNRT